MKQQEQKKPWMLPRHKVITALLKPALGLYCRLRYGVRAEPFRQQGDRAYLILYNHQTGFDQFFVGLCFRGPVYYVATEDVFSMGWVSDLIRWLVAPIPIRKQTIDVQAVMNCMRIARDGGTIAIAPEGNRTYSGRLCHINPAIASLARKLKLPVALLRIEDGYGVQPRWSDVIRRGSMRAYVSQVIEPEELAEMSNDMLLERIRQGLGVEEARLSGTFRHKKSAEYLERAIYVCPDCGLSEFVSQGDTVTCPGCGQRIRYLPTKELEGIGKPFPFRFVADWYDYQEDYVNQLDLSAYLANPMYQDRIRLYKVILYQRKELLREDARLTLYGDRVVIDEDRDNELSMSFGELSAGAVLGKNKLNLYFNGEVYQIRGDQRFNALKYVNMLHRYKNISKGDQDGKFLGL